MHVLQKLIAYGALSISVSDSIGYLVNEDGFDYMKISFLRGIKAQQRSLRDYSKTYARSRYYDEAKPWNERCDVAFAGASQNEIDHSDAIIGCRILVEGSNMPFTPEGVQILRKASVLIAPSMAADSISTPNIRRDIWMDLSLIFCSPCLQVVAGELELNHECSLIHWSPEDFECKLQVVFLIDCSNKSYSLPFKNCKWLLGLLLCSCMPCSY
ncbi:Glutamate dehydrogenase [Glycine soja]